MSDKREASTNKALFRELPYYRVDVMNIHGQFNNSNPFSSFGRNYLGNLPSIYDNDLFNLNTHIDSNINPDANILYNHLRSEYYSPLSFQKRINNFNTLRANSYFSIFHNNVRSLKKNIENLQIHLLQELDYNFNIIAVTETRIRDVNISNVNYDIPGYAFQFVPTPLTAGGVGIILTQI